ncbi:FAD-dependent oxidoreductase [Paenibacillus tarimensis]|uniref:FAD-dependent oxidoreductase n=1 Tax=Paenibacillus tarimensis TaxID=416012 RepID=UPI001F393CDD|nr:NAD(P)/FAD-dependent oxidoreductase [Paenibacillus tarimensis]MCF2945619.1 FAD-dependent monooxygenase [Paenibacillus tarimensis]
MYDVAIVGARCGGAALAAFLGRLNHRVLLIDRFTRPGATLSTHIIGETDVYERLGIRDKMESAGAPAITRMRVDLNGTVFESDLTVTTRVIGLRRELLDPMLLQAAAGPRVTVQLERTARRVILVNGRAAGLVLSDRRGHEETVKARVVVGADGRESTIAGLVNAGVEMSEDYSHGVLYVYAENIGPQAVPALEWYWHDGSVVLVNPIDSSRHCIAAMLPKAKIQAWGSKLLPNLMGWLMQIRMLAPRLSHIRVVGPVRGTPHIQGYIRECFGPGWALVGDACANLHPVAGVGIDNAVCGAEYLAKSLNRYLSGEALWEDALQEYAAQVKERVLPQYEAALKTLARASVAVPSEEEHYLRTICTFPSLVHGLGAHAQQFYSALMEEVTR